MLVVSTRNGKAQLQKSTSKICFWSAAVIHTGNLAIENRAFHAKLFGDPRGKIREATEDVLACRRPRRALRGRPRRVGY